MKEIESKIKVDIVNENDEKIGLTTEHVSTYNRYIITRASVVLLYNKKGEIFLTKRAIHKIRYSSHWDFSVGGMVEAGESYTNAAIRVQEKEIGIKVKKEDFKFIIKKLVKHDKKEFIALFKIVTNKKPKIDETEIESGEFLTKEEILNKIKIGKEKFNPYLLDFIEFI